MYRRLIDKGGRYNYHKKGVVIEKTDYWRKTETKKEKQPDVISYGGDEMCKNARPVMYYTFWGTLADLTPVLTFL